jgi:two-component system sensor histidine kinase DesK
VPERLRPVSAWVVREAVTNVVRHARASRCTVALAPADGEGTVVLRVSDDGVGMGTGADGNGLRGLRERVTAAGAALRSRSDGGTVIEVAV